ncbi:MAG: sulfite exporter TauE/SafE family protein [Methanobacterium sp.]
MFDFNLLLLPLIGFSIGLFVTTLGGGGGGLYVPILILYGVAPQVAVATSLATVLPTTAVGAYSHHRMGNVDVRTGLILGIGGIIGTLIGAYIAILIPPDILKKALGVFLLIMAIPMIRRVLEERKNQEKPEEPEYKETLTLTGFRRIIASFFGVAGGILAGIFGLSGTPPVTAGLYSLGLPVLMVVGTTIFVLVFNSLAGIVGYFLLGRFDITLTLLLGSGAVLGAFLGPKVLGGIDRMTLERFVPLIFILFSIIFGLSLLF